MASEYRVDELERRSNNHGRSLSSLSSRLAAVEQLANMLAGGVGGTFSGATVPEFIARGKVTTAIPTGTWTTPSSSGEARVAFRDGGGTWTEGDIVQVFNDNTMPASIPVNRVVKLGLIEGQWWLLTGSCA